MSIQKLMIAMSFLALIFAIEPIVAANCRQATEQPRDKVLQPGSAFVLCNVKTQVQRRLLGIPPTDTEHNYFLGLNGNMFLESSVVRDAAWDELEKQIKDLPGDNLNLFQAITFYGEFPEPKVLKPIKQKIAHLLKGKLKVRRQASSVDSDPANWNTKMRSFNFKNKVKEEIVFGDDDVTVYSIEAPLSRYLTQGSACHVEILSSLDQDGGFLTESIKQTISRFVEKHKIRKDGRLNFVLNRIQGKGGWERKLGAELKAYGKSIGFLGAGLTYSSNEVNRTEGIALVGQNAIDFELEDWKSGEKQKLSSLSKKGKFVLLNFWGDT